MFNFVLRVVLCVVLLCCVFCCVLCVVLCVVCCVCVVVLCVVCCVLCVVCLCVSASVFYFIDRLQLAVFSSQERPPNLHSALSAPAIHFTKVRRHSAKQSRSHSLCQIPHLLV